MIQRLHGSFPAQTVQTPEKKAIEFSPGCRREHLLELLPVSALPTGAIHVLKNHRPALGRRERLELPKLVVGHLSAVLGADPSVERHSHLSPLTDFYRPPFEFGTILLKKQSLLGAPKRTVEVHVNDEPDSTPFLIRRFVVQQGTKTGSMPHFRRQTAQTR